MKKSVILGILGLATCAATSFGQGVILLDNYNTSGPNVTFGVGAGGTVGAGLPAGWTAGLYYAAGTVASDLTSGNSIPLGLNLGTGTGSTAAFFTTSFATLGEFLAGNPFATTVATGGTITLEIVAYPTVSGSYAAATIRGHSQAFTMAVSDPTSPSPTPIGTFLTGFSVTPVPEPATMALVGLGGLALVAFRRKQS